jgi:hypothetical protein
MYFAWQNKNTNDDRVAVCYYCTAVNGLNGMWPKGCAPSPFPYMYRAASWAAAI